MRVKTFATLILLTTVYPGAALAQQAVTGEQIKSAVSGNTVEGSMLDTGAYTEFYADDGTIRGKEYTGTWSIDGDSMCFAYEGSEKSCWQAAIDGDRIQWLRDGKPVGEGTIRQGNVHNF